MPLAGTKRHRPAINGQLVPRVPSSASSSYHVRHVSTRTLPVLCSLRLSTTKPAHGKWQQAQESSRRLPRLPRKEKGSSCFLPLFHEASAEAPDKTVETPLWQGQKWRGMLPKRRAARQLPHQGSSSRHALSPRSKHTDHPAQLIGFEVLFCSVEHGTSGNNSSLKTSKEEAWLHERIRGGYGAKWW